MPVLQYLALLRTYISNVIASYCKFLEECRRVEKIKLLLCSSFKISVMYAQVLMYFITDP